MTKKEIKAKARDWMNQLEKLLEELQEIEGHLDDPDSIDGFTGTGFASGQLEEALRGLIES